MGTKVDPYVGRRIADINEDERVNLSDLVFLAKYYGQTVPPAPEQCDINLDKEIDLSDLVLLAKNYGAYNMLQNSGFEDNLVGWGTKKGLGTTKFNIISPGYRGNRQLQVYADLPDFRSYFVGSLLQKLPLLTNKWCLTFAFRFENFGALRVGEPINLYLDATHAGCHLVFRNNWIPTPSVPEWMTAHHLIELVSRPGQIALYLDNVELWPEHFAELSVGWDCAIDKIEFFFYSISEPTLTYTVDLDEVRVYRLP